MAEVYLDNFTRFAGSISDRSPLPASWLSEHPITRIVLTGVLAFLLFSQLSFYYKAKTSLLSRIPGPWYGPYTGVHLQYLFANGNIWKYAKAKHDKYGPVIRLGPRQIWVSDKDAIKDILLTTDLPKVTMYAEISRDKQSPGLFGEIRPDPHKRLRRFLGPAFTISAVDDLDYFFMNCVENLLGAYYKEIDKTESKSFVTDIMRDLHCLALDIMGESNFGRGFGQINAIFDPDLIKTDEDKAWFKIPDAIFAGQAKRYGLVYVKRILRSLGMSIQFDWPKEMTTAISKLIEERREEPEEEASGRRRDIMQYMLEEGDRPDNGVKMTNQDIIDQMSELMLAGSETTSGSIGSFFLEIVRNPEKKEKLLKSLPVLGRDDQILDSKTIRTDPTYKYLEACIKEGLRMHPIASELGRRTLDFPYKVGDYEIPPFTIVSASYRQLHRNSDIFPEADRFWPERWLEDDEERGDAPKPDEEAYFPFSAGKHSCIGKNFAYAEIRTVLGNVLSRFDVQEVDVDKEIDFRQFITMQFVDGHWRCRLIPREPKEQEAATDDEKTIEKEQAKQEKETRN